jgi:thiamine pyrophosphate-dependent acetolactate synthase large subunit-like protein
MSAGVSSLSPHPGSTTADDTLKQKTRDAGVISGGHLVAKALKHEGVDTIFTLCGGHIIDINDGCVDEGIRIIDVRHEQVAAHASDGYARQTGKLGCVVTTAGPGCTNAVTGKRQARRKWMAQLQDVEATATEKLMPLFKSNSSPIHPYRVAYELNEFLSDDTVYIGDGGDGGDVVTISAQAVRPRRPGQWMDPGALGSLGVGTGFALAAKLAHPHKEVLCYYGDGSFGMTAFDMETANRFGAPYLAVIGNNSAMNQIRYGQLAKYGEERGNVGYLLSDVPFSKFAEMLGGHGEEVRDPAQIAGALRRAREAIHRTGRSAVVNIWADSREYAPGTKNQTMYK